MTEICQRCKEVDEDRRTLWMACLYEMNELKLPFSMEIIPDARPRGAYANEKHHFYTLRVCKNCRADWMISIKDWFNAPVQKEESCGSGIFIRSNGVTREMTLEEWEKRFNDRAT